MFFSFFVPKISTTMSNTINQCQTLNEPMDGFRVQLGRDSRSSLRHGRARP